MERSTVMQGVFERIEKKYMLTQTQYRWLITDLAPYIKPDAYANYEICNVYYDTFDYELIQESLNRPVYKEKLRMRSYGTPDGSDNVFIEIKKKYDGVVYKRRISTDIREAVDFMKTGRISDDSQIKREIDWMRRRYELVPAAYIRYDREAYSGIDDPELRITFDRNIRGRDYDLDLRKGQTGVNIIPKGSVLLEIKIAGAAPLWLSHALSADRAFPVSFSKYGSYYENYIAGDHAQEVLKYA